MSTPSFRYDEFNAEEFHALNAGEINALNARESGAQTSLSFSYQPQVQHRLSNMVYSAAGPLSSFPDLESRPLQSQVMQYDPKFEDEAFELAFAEAERVIQTAETAGETVPGTASETSETAETAETGATTIDLKEGLDSRGEGDKLAETAGELFDRLRFERENDEKFRNSHFMALMRKLRDREVVVEGNEMVESVREGERGINAMNGIEGEERVDL